MTGARRAILTHLRNQMTALETDLVWLTRQEKEEFDRLPDTTEGREFVEQMEDEIHALELAIVSSAKLIEYVQAALDR